MDVEQVALNSPAVPADVVTSPAIASTMEPMPHAATPLVTPVVVKPEAEIILSAGMPKVQSYALPLDELAQIAQQSGLNWVNSDVAKVAAAQEAIAAEPKAVRTPRARPPAIKLDDRPLVLVETRRDLRHMTLPFENTPQA